MTRPAIDHIFKPGKNFLYSQFESAHCVELVGTVTGNSDYRTTCYRLESEHEAAGFKRKRIRLSGVMFNPLDYDNPAERELQSELHNQGIQNAPEPICCPTCKGELETSQGMVGERVLVCAIDGLVWEDHEDAIRRVI